MVLGNKIVITLILSVSTFSFFGQITKNSTYYMEKNYLITLKEKKRYQMFNPVQSILIENGNIQIQTFGSEFNTVRFKKKSNGKDIIYEIYDLDYLINFENWTKEQIDRKSVV